jgi:hypothetical protein
VSEIVVILGSDGKPINTIAGALQSNLNTLLSGEDQSNSLFRAVGPRETTYVHNPAAAAQATIAAPAAGVGVRNICRSLGFSIACAATAQGPIHVYLRDGATGAGTIKRSWVLSAPVNGAAVFDVSGLEIPGSPNTAMTIEFEAAGVAASVESVSLGVSTEV